MTPNQNGYDITNQRSFIIFGLLELIWWIFSISGKHRIMGVLGDLAGYAYGAK